MRKSEHPEEGTGYTNEEINNLTQKQRRLESSIRKLKRQKEVMESQDFDTKEVNARIREKQRQLRELIAANDKVLARQSWREQAGYMPEPPHSLGAKSEYSLYESGGETANVGEFAIDVTKVPDALEDGDRVPFNTEEDFYENGKELYRRFIEGDAADIHRLCGYDFYHGVNEFDPSIMDEDVTAMLDSQFSKSGPRSDLLKGAYFTMEQLAELDGTTYTNRTLSSTTVSMTAAHEYCSRAFDINDSIDDEDEWLVPVLIHLNVEAGTPVADARKILGDSGMKTFEQETTIGRNTDWVWDSIDMHGFDSEDWDGLVHAYVTVRPSDTIVLSKREYAGVCSAITNVFDKKYQGKERGMIDYGSYSYWFEIDDIGEYRFTRKVPLF